VSGSVVNVRVRVRPVRIDRVRVRPVRVRERLIRLIRLVRLVRFVRPIRLDRLRLDRLRLDRLRLDRLRRLRVRWVGRWVIRNLTFTSAIVINVC
jgi:hypothetical protein